MATIYVRNWGNDNNNGLTEKTAKKTQQGAIDAISSGTIDISGYYFGETDYKNLVYYTCKNSMFNYSYSSTDAIKVNSAGVDGINCKNFDVGIRCLNNLEYVRNSNIDNCIYAFRDSYGGELYQSCRESTCNIITRCTYVYHSLHTTPSILSCSTLHNNSDVYLFATVSGFPDKTELINNIISNNEKLTLDRIELAKNLNHTLFINQKIRLIGGGLGTDESVETYPTGATDADKMQNLRDRAAIVYGGIANDYFDGCQYYSGSYNDIFIDADNGNFYLKETGIAATMSFEGKYIGAKGVGKEIFISEFNSLSNFNASTGQVTDQTIDAIAFDSPIRDLGEVRNILNLEEIGVNAYRNGIYKNTDDFLGAEITAGSSVLTAGEPYYVYSGSITLDDSGTTTYNVFDTFTAVDEGGGAGLGFSGAGIVKKVNIDKYDNKMYLKCSKVDPNLTGAVEIQLFLNQTPEVNIDVNGEPVLGNADAGFDELEAVPLSMRYYQQKATYKADSLKVR